MPVRFPRLPDLLTTANLSCGMAAILLASQGQLTVACWLVFAGAAFDVLDGLAARALGGGTELGKQLDSLADLVTFGVAPGMIVFQLMIINYPWPFASSIFGLLESVGKLIGKGGEMIPRKDLIGIGIAPLIITIASCWRLARFNTDVQQRPGFLGLATPFHAMLWASLGLVSARASRGLLGAGPQWTRDLTDGLFSTWWMVGALALLLGVLMLSPLPLPSLKFRHFRWQGNEVIYLLLAIGVTLVALYGMLAVPPILLLYLLSPLWGKLFPKHIQPQRRDDAT